MIRQQYDDDIDDIKTPDHIAKVWSTVEERYAVFLKRLLKSVPSGTVGVPVPGHTVKTKPVSGRDPTRLVTDFEKTIARFEKSAPSYREFFERESFEEFHFSPPSFKRDLGRKCPIIRHTLNSKSKELVDWHRRFNITDAKTLLDMFNNVLGFANEFMDNTDPDDFSRADSLEEIDFETIEDDEECRIDGVVGMGIKSDVLHHLDPALFPARDRRSLLGFYLLSDCDSFQLKSRSSEFVMYDPERKSAKGASYASHNFWYSYALFTLYSLRLFRLLKRDLQPLGVGLDDGLRFVYTASFLRQVTDLEQAKIDTFLGRDVIGDYESDTD